MEFAEITRRLGSLTRRERNYPLLKRAAILVPLFVRDGCLHMVLTQRPETLKHHPGQVAFPGGKIGKGEEVLAAALREAEEELAIPPGEVEPLGALHDVVVITGFCMTPWVGRIPDGLEMTPSPDEVARVFTVPLAELVDPAITRFSMRPSSKVGRLIKVPSFEWRDEVIWGATGRVVLDLLELLGMWRGGS